MKLSLIPFLLLFISCGLLAQPVAIRDSSYWRYADITAIAGGGAKVKVVINYGQHIPGMFKMPEVMRDTVSDKPLKFNNLIDAMNYMSMEGWELVESYFTQDPGATTPDLHFIIRRKELKSK